MVELLLGAFRGIGRGLMVLGLGVAGRERKQ